jgi:hypothetical protein
MKTKFSVIVIVAYLFAYVPNAGASDADGGAIIADVVIARPLCLAATAVGSAFFVLALPFALVTRNVNQTAQALVVTPAKATFTRQLGDFESIKD